MQPQMQPSLMGGGPVPALLRPGMRPGMPNLQMPGGLPNLLQALSPGLGGSSAALAGFGAMAPPHMPQPPSVPGDMEAHQRPPAAPSGVEGVAPMLPPNPPLHVPIQPPNETLYVNNLNDQIRPDELKKHLRSIFKQFGEIRDIIAFRSFWRRGQAWIIFQDRETAAKALNGLQGFPLYDKPMRINFAIAKSDLVAKEEGTYKPRASEGPKKPRAIREREEKQKTLFQQMQQQFLQHMQQQMGQPNLPTGAPVRPPFPTTAPPLANNMSPVDKRSLIAAAQAKAAEAVREAGKRRPQDGVVPTKHPMFQNSVPMAQPTASDAPPMPSRTLFVENLPDGVTDEVVTSLFNCYPGFIEARLISARRIAFVDYESNAQSTMAMHGNQGREIQSQKLRISYAK